MSSQEEFDDNTRLVQTLPPEGSVARATTAPNGENCKKRKPWGIIGGLTLALVVGGGVVGYELKKARNNRQHEIAAAQAHQVAGIEAHQKSGKPLNTYGGMIALLPGTKMRSSILEANPKYNGIIPGNIAQTVKEGQVVILSSPIEQQEGALWLQASPFATETEDYEMGSASALSEATISVNYTGLTKQKAAMACNVTSKNGNATVSKAYGYNGADGQTAFYYTLSKEAFEAQMQEGTLDCH